MPADPSCPSFRLSLNDPVHRPTHHPHRPLHYGQRYVLVFEMVGLRGSAIVRSLWIVRTGEDIPRLTSCYVLLRRQRR
ncbi:MAG: DUF6883 domain-containing protein [Anaerolineae bacterium]